MAGKSIIDSRRNFWSDLANFDPAHPFGVIQQSVGRSSFEVIRNFAPNEDPTGSYLMVKARMLAAVKEWIEKGWLDKGEVEGAVSEAPQGPPLGPFRRPRVREIPRAKKERLPTKASLVKKGTRVIWEEEEYTIDAVSGQVVTLKDEAGILWEAERRDIEVIGPSELEAAKQPRRKRVRVPKKAEEKPPAPPKEKKKRGRKPKPPEERVEVPKRERLRRFHGPISISTLPDGRYFYQDVNARFIPPGGLVKKCVNVRQ